jgi:hypothetical protein
VRVQPGSALVEGVSSPYSMLTASDAKYGERAGSNATPQGALGLARALAEPARLFRRAGEKGAAEVAK